MNSTSPLSQNTPANDVDPPARPSLRRIGAQVGARSLLRAQRCDAWRAVYDARAQGSTLKARCEGSQGEAWRTSVTVLDDGGLVARCSCPVGEAGACKHVGATLLAWLARPGRFARRPTLEAQIARLDEREARAALRALASRSAELESLVEDALPAAPDEVEAEAPDCIERVGEAFRRLEREADAGEVLADEVERVLADAVADAGPDNLAGVVRAHEQVLRGVLGRARRLGDGAAPLRPVVRRCLDAMADAARRIEDRASRVEALWSLVALMEFDIERGVAARASAPGRTGVRLAVEAATAEDRAALVERVRDRMEGCDEWSLRAWTGVYVELVRGALDDERWFALCREHQRHAPMATRLLELGRVDEALAAAERVGDGAVLELADAFVRHGAGEPFAEMLSARVARASESNRQRIAAWLSERAAARRDDAAAADLAERMLKARPSAEAWEALRDAATRAGVWTEARARSLRALEEAAHPLLVEVLLAAGDLRRACEVACSPRAQTPSFRAAREALAARLEGEAPVEAARVLRAQAEALIAQRGRAGYVDACAALARARRVLCEVGRGAEADGWIDALRAKHANRPALKQLMELHFGEAVREAG
ncbi:MAG: hypothetical protein R3A48_04295 [Polyangiales bacterium]